MKRIMAATGNKKMDNFIINIEGYTGVGRIADTDKLYDSVMYFEPDILVVSENLKGQTELWKVLLALNRHLTRLKIVYLLSLRVDYYDLENLKKLVNEGITNIYLQNRMTAKEIKNMLSDNKALDEILVEMYEIEKGLADMKDISASPKQENTTNSENNIKEDRRKKAVDNTTDTVRINNQQKTSVENINNLNYEQRKIPENDKNINKGRNDAEMKKQNGKTEIKNNEKKKQETEYVVSSKEKQMNNKEETGNKAPVEKTGQTNIRPPKVSLNNNEKEYRKSEYIVSDNKREAVKTEPVKPVSAQTELLHSTKSEYKAKGYAPLNASIIPPIYNTEEEEEEDILDIFNELKKEETNGKAKTLVAEEEKPVIKEEKKKSIEANTETDSGYIIAKHYGDSEGTIDTELMTKDFFESYKEASEYKNIIDNLSIVSSIKPGTGKSFMSVNLATAIARYGIKPDGTRPKVGLIEGDLQNLSIGTLLQIEDSKRNLKAVMDKISTIVTKEGEFVGSPQEVEVINSFIKSSFLPYNKLPNLKCLVGSQLTFKEIEDIAPHYYTYLIEAMEEEFDVLIVDTNSALTHVTTFPLLQMAKNCFYILNLDFNNVRNNTRYRETLKDLGVMDKVKYILNEDIRPEMINKNSEELIYTSEHLAESGFNLVGKVPIVDKTVFLNRLYTGTPLVLDEGVKNTEIAKNELLKIANVIYPIEGIDKIVKKEQTKKNKGFFLFG